MRTTRSSRRKFSPRLQFRRHNLVIEEMESRLVLSPFVVNSNDDADFGTCDVVHCSLREAITAANQHAGADGITFNIPGSGVPTIHPQSPLPAITEAVTIDATSQAAGKVELDGTDAGPTTDGITITGGNSTLQGLVINRFGGNGIHLKTSGGNFVMGNLIGTDAAGSADMGNSDAGIFVDDSPSNVIGPGNIISANETQGIAIFGSRATLNRVVGNFIGTDATGTQDLGNGDSGVLVDSAPGNTIGDEHSGNVISGNEISGVTLYRSGARGNVIAGNMIGTDVTGALDVGNGFDGVIVNGAPNNTIGGTAAGARNVIAANEQHGVQLFRSGAAENVIEGNLIGTDVTGTRPMGNRNHGIFLSGAPGNTVGGTTAEARNVISGNAMNGVSLNRSGATGNVIAGNYIGTDATGAAAVGNTSFGVFIDGAPGNTIGGTVAGSGNVIAANGIDGVQLSGPESRGNLVAGNRIGVDVTGTTDLGNLFSGVALRGASGNTVGGTSSTARNVISGNNTNGVFFDGAATENLVQGNYIGTDVTGSAALANSNYGVIVIAPSSRNIIGGTQAGARNVISGNGFDGVLIFADGATSNQVLGNFIGTDAAGTAELGNLFSGASVRSASSNSIGGPSPEARNIISGNGTNGVFMDGPASNNLVQGNFVGTDITGRLGLGNRANGVMLVSPASHNTIGGTAAGAGNVIASNGGDGVQISGADATHNEILGNLIGTDVTGSDALGNLFRGVSIGPSSSGNMIGGSSPGSGNVISSNGRAGISLAADAFANVVQGNLIGTDGTGRQMRGNDGAGISIDNSPDNTIGGTEPGAGNVISGNQLDGIEIIGFDSDGQLIAGNRIGTDILGDVAIPNGGAGVSIDSASAATVGGTTPEARNIISGNGGPGVHLTNIFGFSDTLVQGNYIGTASDGTSALGNRGAGVRSDFSNNVRIGGDDPAAGNVITFNGGDGVTVFPAPGRNLLAFVNSILSNSISFNQRSGIDIGDDGVSHNSESSGNRNRVVMPNFPELKSAELDGTTVVRGSLVGTPHTRYVVQFFANTKLDPSRFGEGERFVGSANVRTNGRGIAAFRVTLQSLVKRGEFITATATDPDGNTSEFSKGIAVHGGRSAVRRQTRRL